MTKGQVSSLADQIPEFYITTEVSPDGLIGRATGFVLAQDAGGASRIMEREVAQALDVLDIEYTEVVVSAVQNWPEDLPVPGALEE